MESEVTTERAWPADEKVVAEELGPFLTRSSSHQGASRNGEAAASALGAIQRSVFRPEQVRGKTLMWRLQAPSRLGCMNSPAQDAVDPPTPLFDEGALELDVGDVMTTGVVTVRDDATLDEAVDAMAAHRIHAMLVVGTRAGTALGWINTRGLLGLIGWTATPATEAITEEPKSIEPRPACARRSTRCRSLE